MLLLVISSSLFAQKEGEYKIPYNLHNPHNRYSLKAELNEISGISFVNKNVLACVQDEKGEVFFYDLNQRKCISSFSFHDDGDFEDIQVIGRNALLIACKGSASIRKKNNLDDYKAVYRYDLKKKKLLESPVMLIDKNNLIDNTTLVKETKASAKVDLLREMKSDLNFRPSAIAIHPFTGNVYILSFVGRLLTSYSPSGILLDIEYLDKKIFSQPEGMCFDEKGNLYIANEANGLGASILSFEYLN